jgi:hypothetical protein
MIAGEEENIQAEIRPLEIVWRNPLTEAQESLRIRELCHPYYQWAEQAGKIRARRAHWNITHCGAA